MKRTPNKPTQRKFLAKQVRLIRYPLEKLLQRYVQLELSVSCHFIDTCPVEGPEVLEVLPLDACG